MGDTLFSPRMPGTRTPELWKSDGSVQGTVKVSSASRDVGQLTAAGSNLFFTANDAQGQSRDVAHRTERRPALNAWWTLASGQPHIAGAGARCRGRRMPDAEDATAAAATLVTKDPVDGQRHAPIEVISPTLCELLEAGKTRMTLRLTLDSPNPDNPVVLLSSTDPAHASGLQIVTRESTGVAADLYDAQGGLLARQQSILDLRALDAGTFFLRVYNPAATAQTAPLSFTFEATPPIPGFSQPAPDRTYPGPDGDDIIIGNEHLTVCWRAWRRSVRG